MAAHRRELFVFEIVKPVSPLALPPPPQPVVTRSRGPRSNERGPHLVLGPELRQAEMVSPLILLEERFGASASALAVNLRGTLAVSDRHYV